MPDMNKPNAKGKTIMDYLPQAMQKLGQKQTAFPQMQAATMKQPIDKKVLEETIQTLKDYKAGKANFEKRIEEEERWWKLRHWEVIRGSNAIKTQQNAEEARPEPSSAWMFNSIANKHADVMDNFPEPAVLPRERADEQDAKTLSSILPVIFERNEYEQTYSRAAWYKLKHGVAAKGVFFNKELENGLGDVDIPFIDMLNIFWEPGITDLQDSRNVFVVSLKDNDLLEIEYPNLKGKLGGNVINVQEYALDDNVDTSNKSLVVDWYYKKSAGIGQTILHYCKFVGSEILFASENEPGYENGYYEHGRYPIVFDVLFPEEGTPTGFGYIALMKSPQLYIDKLSQVILENTMMSAKPRFFIKKNAGINVDEFLDWSKPLAEYEGDVNNIKPIEVQPVGSNVLNVLQMKIDELKETSSNRDVSQGSSSGGVTAAAAIAALQEAGNKTSRDLIAGSYRSYKEENYLAIELVRQFYDMERTFRITGETGGYEFITFSNAGLQGKPVGPAYPGQEMEMGYKPATRVPVFDIVVKPQKRSPYSKMAQNELAKELYQMGFFNPQMAEQTLGALELMDFDGIEKVKEKAQQGQTLLQQMQIMSEQLTMLALEVKRLRGEPIDAPAGSNAQGGKSSSQRPPQKGGGKSMGSAITDAQGANMTAYGQRLAANAKPDMNG